MIKLFRSIRQNLLSNPPESAGSVQVGGKYSRYLKYALGEIILVVFGILIALQINNWNERQKEIAQSIIYVNSLIEDLRKDSTMYDDQVEAAQLKYRYCKEIGGIFKDKKPIIDTSAFIVNLQSAGRLIIPTIADNTYKDLVSTGNLKLIDDKKSTDAIREYYSNPLEWWYEDYKDQLVNGYLPIVVDAIPLHLNEEILENEIVDTFQDFTDKALLNNQVHNFSEQDIQTIFAALQDNERFYFNLKRITRSHLVQMKILLLSKKSAITLLERLEEWKKINS